MKLGDDGMYLYKITNLINQKMYIGITNNYKKRWANHRCGNDTSMPIALAIKKYGKENFNFEVLESNIPIDAIEDKEKEAIIYFNSLVPNGYNVAKGGFYNQLITPKYGVDNGRALLTEEEVTYIKNHRNQPFYLLYEDFNQKLSYEQFKKIYHNKVYPQIQPCVEEYQYNFEYSCQFNSSKFTPQDIIYLRECYVKGLHWKEVYQDYKNYCCEENFWKIYTGRNFTLVMPEVFTEENIKKHSSKSAGEKNPKAKLTQQQVLDIRKKYKDGTSNQDLYNEYNFVTHTTIRNIINYKTWKSL